ncbi:hypothetical protein ACJZ2D_015652 [Fusarium nematophilum]
MAPPVGKFEFLIYMPDHAGASHKRQATRPLHIQGMKEDPEDFWQMGGFSVAEHPKAGGEPSPNGSAMIVYAESKDQVLERLQNDVFAKEGIWDVDNAHIVPFYSVVRRPV